MHSKRVEFWKIKFRREKREERREDSDWVTGNPDGLKPCMDWRG